MRLTIDRKPLLSALQRASSVAPPKSPHPLLSCVLIEVSGTELSIRASELPALSLTQRLACEAQEPGTAALNAKDLTQIVTNLPDGTITISQDGEKIILKSGKRRFQIQSAPANDFPPEHGWQLGEPFAVPAAVLRSTIQRVEHATGQDQSRPALECVQVRSDGNRISALATSGQAAAIVSADCVTEPLDVLIHSRVRKSLLDLLDTDEPVTVRWAPSAMRVATPTATLTLAIPNEKLPPVDIVLERLQAKTICRVDAEQLHDAVSAVSGAADNADILLDVGDVAILVKSDTRPGTKSGQDEITAEHTGPNVEVACSAKLLTGALKQCSGTISLEFGDELDPIVVRDGSFVEFMAPMRKRAAAT